MVVTFEHAPANLTLKLLCACAGVNLRDVQRGYADLAKLRRAAGLGIRGTTAGRGGRQQPAHGGTGARPGTARHAAHQAERCLVVVDYLQLWAKVAEDLRGNFSVRERVDMLGGLLRELALGLHSPVLVASKIAARGIMARAKAARRWIRSKKVAIWSMRRMWWCS